MSLQTADMIFSSKAGMLTATDYIREVKRIVKYLLYNFALLFLVFGKAETKGANKSAVPSYSC